MEVLVYLAERPGAVVSRVELEASVWAGSVVGYDTVTGAIQKLRKAFGDNPRQPRVIETLSKKGYRLVAPVGPAATPTAGTERRADFRTTGNGGRRKTDRVYGPLAYRPMLVVALAVLLVGVVAGVLLWSE